MNITEMPTAEALRLATHRYTEHLRQLHLLVRDRLPPPVYLMEALEQARQIEEMAMEAVTRETARKWGGANELDELEQIELPLGGAA